MRRSIGFILLFLAATTLSAATTRNDASCDISALPAATLLLPYFHGDRIVDPDEVPSQSWVIVSMEADGRYSVDFDAPALGNGCSPTVGITGEGGEPPAIGPAANGDE